ncbi:MAG: amidase [Acidimicrobiia bacterium]
MTDTPGHASGDDLSALDATAQAQLVRDGTLSATELVEAAITRIEKMNPQLNAVIHPLFDKARATAAATEPGAPFAGVPIVLKDHDGESAGDPVHHGNRVLKEIGHVADHDSYLFAKLRAAGFIAVGKTNTPELGLMTTTEPEAYGPTRNPWNTGHSTGGSSGGSAAAVASGMVPVGHAGDGGGSIRIPTSECGLFGLKPTRGRVSLGPEAGEAWAGLVQRHVITRSVRDSAAVLDALGGPMPGDPYFAPPPARPFLDEVGADPGRLRIGIRTNAPAAMAETYTECATAAEDAGRLLESLGHHVEVASPAALDETELLGLFLVLMSTNVVADLREIERIVGRELTPDDVEPLTWEYAQMGRGHSGSDYLEAVHGAHAWTRRVASWFEPLDDTTGFDLLLTPTLAEPPPEIGDLVGTKENPWHGMARSTPFAAYTAAFNVTGQPAMSVPLSWESDRNLPIGVQLVATHAREDLLLRVAAQLEEARPWADRRPPVFA